MRRSGFCVVLLTAALVAGSAAPASASHGGLGHLAVCCAWNGGIGDGPDANTVPDLTFSVSGGTALDRNSVRSAVQDWAVALGGALEFIEVASTDKTANVRITLKAGGGVIAGSAKRSADRSGFIKQVAISISLKAFGVPNDQAKIALVTRHEFGHALGVGHTDFAADLMAPEIGPVSAISGCDREGVRQAQHWKLVDAAATPHQPHVTSVNCP